MRQLLTAWGQLGQQRRFQEQAKATQRLHGRRRSCLLSTVQKGGSYGYGLSLGIVSPGLPCLPWIILPLILRPFPRWHWWICLRSRAQGQPAPGQPAPELGQLGTARDAALPEGHRTPAAFGVPTWLALCPLCSATSHCNASRSAGWSEKSWQPSGLVATSPTVPHDA